MALPSWVLARVQIKADIAGGEQLVHTFHFGKAAAGDFDGVPWDAGDSVALAQTVVDDWSVGVGSQPQVWSATTNWKTASAYLLDGQGRALEASEAPFAATDHGSATDTLPGELALCVSLRTARAGRSYRGRVFLGGFGTQTVDPNTGRCKGPYALAAMTSVQHFINMQRSRGHAPVIYSRLHGTMELVTHLDVGDVFDVQRRRRDALRETRQGVSLESTTW